MPILSDSNSLHHMVQKHDQIPVSGCMHRSSDWSDELLKWSDELLEWSAEVEYWSFDLYPSTALVLKEDTKRLMTKSTLLLFCIRAHY